MRNGADFTRAVLGFLASNVWLLASDHSLPAIGPLTFSPSYLLMFGFDLWLLSSDN